jgi:hypothetical protein
MGYELGMRLKAALLVGLFTVFGAAELRRRRYLRLRRMVRQAQSAGPELFADKARAVLDLSVERAKDVVSARLPVVGSSPS